MSKTPPSVRVARWAAIAAAITGLFTVGNTFIEKRPWFLGGEDEKPSIVQSVPKPEPKVENYSSPSPIRFTIPSAEDSAKKMVVSEPAEALVMSSMSSNMETAKSMNVMSVAPDMGWWNNFLNFMYYRPIPFWIITISVFFIIVFFVTESLHHRKKNKDKTKWTIDNPNYSAGPDIQKPLQ